jgi:hypothetical protein
MLRRLLCPFGTQLTGESSVPQTYCTHHRNISFIVSDRSVMRARKEAQSTNGFMRWVFLNSLRFAGRPFLFPLPIALNSSAASRRAPRFAATRPRRAPAKT